MMTGAKSTPKRILALLTDAFGGVGGIAQYNRDFLGALATADAVENILVLPRRGAAERCDPHPRIRQSLPIGGRIAYAHLAGRAALRDGPFDVVFCGHLFMAPLAAIIAFAIGTPLWLQVHGIEAWERPTKLQRWAAERAALITAVSRHTRRRLLSWANVDPHRVRVLPNTVGPQFVPGPKPDYLLDRYGLHGKKILLTVSRLAASERYKGHDRVLKALPEILKQQPETIYLIVGDGDDRPRLQAMTSSLALDDIVRFAGAIEPADLPDYYRLANVFVMPSTGEGFGIAFLEAAASGLPAIGGNSDGSIDALAIGTTTDPNNQATLTAVIVAALQHGRIGSPDISRFGVAQFARHTIDLAESIMRER
jgi:phosphatidyl-myo-inositol dimannoside synthase